MHHKLLSECQTGAEYILSIDLQENGLGFYFGLYEMGKFRILNNSNIEIISSHKIHFVDKGWALNQDTLIISFRDHMNRDANKNYSIIGLKWSDNFKPEKLWELKPTFSLNAFTQINEEIIALGYLNGSLELYSIKKMEIIESKKIFDSGFAYMHLKDRKIYCSSMKGEIACLSLNGDIIWKNKIDDSQIHNIEIKRKKLHVVTSNKKYYIINPKTGKIFQMEDFKKEKYSSFSSNFIFHEDAILISGDACIYSISKVGIETRFRSDDPLIRTVHSVPNGYLTGDDDGKLKLCHYSDIRLSKRRRAIPLFSY